MSFVSFSLNLCIIFYFILNVCCIQLPPELKACRRTDPNFNECVRGSVEDALRKLANGNKQIGLNALEPLFIDAISVGRIPNSPVNIDQKFTNIKLHGLSRSKINKFEVDLKTFNLFAEAFTPELITEADFEIKGQLLIFPINGKGPSNITMTNLKSYHNITCERYQKKGTDYLRLTDYKITIKPEKIHYKFDNVLGGETSARLNAEVHKVINQNALGVFEEVRSATEESYALIFKQIANRIFNKVPLDEIYKL